MKSKRIQSDFCFTKRVELNFIEGQHVIYLFPPKARLSFIATSMQTYTYSIEYYNILITRTILLNSE